MMRPAIYNSESELPQDATRIDALRSAYRELFFIEHPQASKVDTAETDINAFFGARAEQYVWVHYPWHRIAVRIPDEATYFKLRTARNRNLITSEEQKVYRDAIVGIAGLSVGSAAAATIVSTGGPRRIKLADPDTIEISNLNRMRATLAHVGTNKADVAARGIWDIDPFADVEIWDKGVDVDGLGRFISDPRLSVFVDEMDDIALKIASRTACRARGIPVVMATDNGDGAILDVERYDIEPNRPIFHGRVSIDEAIERGDREQFVRLANQIIDPKLFTSRQLESVKAIGVSLSGVAQIATGASIAGAAVAYAVRAIVCNFELSSGRYLLSTEDSLRAGISL